MSPKNKRATADRPKRQDASPVELGETPALDVLVRDLLTLLGYFERQSVRRVATGGLGKKTAQRIAPFLRQGAEDYAAFLGLFLIDRKVLVENEDRWDVSRSNLERLWSPDRLLRTLYTFWVQTPWWNESLQDADVLASVRREYISQDPALESRRRRLAEELRGFPEGEWSEFSSLLTRVERNLPGRDRSGDESGITPSGGRLSPAETLRRMLTGPLAWLGIVEHRQAPDEAFAVTRLGHLVLSERWSDIARALNGGFSRENARVTIQPNLEILVPPDLTAERALDLARIADLKSVDVVSTFEISWESVMNGLDRGSEPEDILELLREVSATGVPETVEQLVRDCGGRHGEVQIGTDAALLEVRDPAILRAVRAHPRLASSILRTFGDEAALLAPNTDLDWIEKELGKAGFNVTSSPSDKVKTTEHGVHLAPNRRELEELYAAVRVAIRLVRETDPDFDLSTVASLEEMLGLELTRLEDSRARERALEYETLLQRLLKKRSRTDEVESPGPNVRVQGTDEIRQLLVSCVESGTPVEIEYDGFQGFTHRIVEPASFDGRYLTGFCRLRQDERNFNSARILSARTVK